MNFKIHFLFYFYFKIIQISCKTVSLKFNEFYDENIEKSQSINIGNNDINIYSELYDYLLYTIINIGKPNQLILGFFNSDTNIFVINNNENCQKIKKYNYSFTNSESSEIINEVKGDDYFPGYFIVNDTIIIDVIENGMKESKEILDFQFKYEKPKRSWGKDDVLNKIYCAEIGFLINKEKKTWSNFIKHLKDINIIDSYIITMNYTSNNEGFFYIGDFPHKYDHINFKEYQLTSTYAIPKPSFSQFRILMDDIYIIINETQTYKIIYNEVYFHLELGLIEASTDYFNFIKNTFFKEYINKKICRIELMTKNLNNYYMIICEKNNSFNLKLFPTLYLYHSELNRTFTLDYNDLFYLQNDKYYFLIIYSTFSGSYWKLGKPFLKKYQITLDLDSKKIYFYDTSLKDDKKEDTEINKDNYLIHWREILLIVFCSILFIILLIVLIKSIKKNRKKRANELKDDDYEYTGIDNANQNSEANQIVNNDGNSDSIN